MLGRIIFVPKMRNKIGKIPTKKMVSKTAEYKTSVVVFAVGYFS
jgi:hypothetical protein